MIDLGRIIAFEWDEGNARKSAEKHDVSQAEAEQVFLNQPLLVLADTRHGRSETRFHALGTTASGRHLHVAFALREGDTKIRINSARDMHRKERRRYDQET